MPLPERSGCLAPVGRMAGRDIAGLALAQLLKSGRTDVDFLRLRIEDVSDVVAEHVTLKDDALEGSGEVVEHRCTEFASVPGHPGELVCLVASQATKVCGEGMVVASKEVDSQSGRAAGDPLGVVEY